MLQNSRPLHLALVFPLLFVFGLPLLSAQKITTNERLKLGVRYLFSSAGLYVETSVAKADLQWRAIQQAVETKSAFLLFPSVNVAHTLPKRCFADAADVAAFRQLLLANVPKAQLASN